MEPFIRKKDKEGNEYFISQTLDFQQNLIKEAVKKELPFLLKWIAGIIAPIILKLLNNWLENYQNSLPLDHTPLIPDDGSILTDPNKDQHD